MSSSFFGRSIISRSASCSSFTLASLSGYAHISSTTGLPLAVAMSKLKPASRKWSIGTSISTGWLPVWNVLPFFIRMSPSSVQTTRMGLLPVYLLVFACFTYLVWQQARQGQGQG